MGADRSKEPRYGTPDDEAPELTEEMMKRAVPLPELLSSLGLPPLSPGRPRLVVTKTPINLRLDPEILEHFKAGGPGWQTRINAVLGRHVRAAKAAARRKQG